MIAYDEYRYLWPPRPETKIPRSALAFYHGLGFAAQVKKNGTCTLIFAHGSSVIFQPRHGPDSEHKAWSPLPEHIQFFQGRKNWNVYVAELLHSKTPHIKNQLYIFDKLVHDGEYLVGHSLLERHNLLLMQDWPLSKTYADERDQIRIGEYVTIAKFFTEGFNELFNSLKPEDEGLVLKRIDSKLERCMRQGSNSSWQVKCRVPTRNYSF